MQLSISSLIVQFPSRSNDYRVYKNVLWSNSLEKVSQIIIILNAEAQKLKECNFNMSRNDKRKQHTIKVNTEILAKLQT